ncbi:MAG: phosphomethylpyrimidine kinase [Methanomicrobiales archaeon]|nr:phosphomethylpyrimidine kinase [Methanomicrobiales archaeon]
MENERDLNEQIEMHGKMRIALDLLESCQEFAQMIPEVRTNLVYARESAERTDDVLAIDGRVTVVGGMPHASGDPKFGASSHMARLLLEIRRRDPTIRAGINFANTPSLSRWLEIYCKRKGWVFSVIDRRSEPEAIKEAEGASMPWKVGEAIRAAGGRVPNVFYETGAVGKEPVTVLVGSDPIVVVSEMINLTLEYQRG